MTCDHGHEPPHCPIIGCTSSRPFPGAIPRTLEATQREVVEQGSTKREAHDCGKVQSGASIERVWTGWALFPSSADGAVFVAVDYCPFCGDKLTEEPA